MNSTVAFTTGIFLGLAEWTATKIFTDFTEPWDAPIGTFVMIFFLPMISFIIAYRYGFVKMLLLLVGMLVGDTIYMYIIHDMRYITIGIIISASFMFYSLLSGVAGWLFGMFWKKYSYKILNDKPNKPLHDKGSKVKPFYYKATAKWFGYYSLIGASVFGVIGLLLVLYPSPPLSPIKGDIMYFTVKTIAVLFLVGFIWEGYRGVQMIKDDENWNILVDDKYIYYKTPQSSRETSFECSLENVRQIQIIYPKDLNSEKEVHYTIITKDEKTYAFGYGENFFPPDKFVNALRKRDVKVDIIYI